MNWLFSDTGTVYRKLGMSPAMIVFWCLVAAFAFWAYASRFDVTVAEYFWHHHHDAWKQDVFGYLSRMGQAWFQVAVCCILGFWYYKKGMLTHSRAWYLSVPIFLIVGIAGFVLKTIFGRPRPKMLDEMYIFQWFELPARLHAFPSGHTLTTFSLLATVAFLYPKYGQVLLWIAATILAFARVGIGSHWLGDIVFGAVVGYCVASFFKRKFKLERQETL